MGTHDDQRTLSIILDVASKFPGDPFCVEFNKTYPELPQPYGCPFTLLQPKPRISVGFSCATLHPGEDCGVHKDRLWWPFAIHNSNGTDLERFTLPFLVVNQYNSESHNAMANAAKRNLFDIIPAIKAFEILFDEQGLSNEFTERAQFYSMFLHRAPHPNVYWTRRTLEETPQAGQPEFSRTQISRGRMELYRCDATLSTQQIAILAQTVLADAHKHFLPGLIRALAVRRERFESAGNAGV